MIVMLYQIKLKRFNTFGLIKDKNTSKAVKVKFIYLAEGNYIFVYLCTDR